MNKQLRVGILTPYLTGEVLRDYQDNEVKLQQQKEKYGAQDITTLLNQFEQSEPCIFTSKKSPRIVLQLSADGNQYNILKNSDLAIVGCTSTSERDTSIFSHTGLFMGRCSIFYGNRSEYTGLMPEQSGHAFDLPKDAGIIMSFLTDKSVGKAMIDRNYNSICKAVEKLNSDLSKPIIITPYLESACRISKDEQKKNMAHTISWYESSCGMHKGLKAFEYVLERDPTFAKSVKNDLERIFNSE